MKVSEQTTAVTTVEITQIKDWQYFKVNKAFQVQDLIHTEKHFNIQMLNADWELSCFQYSDFQCALASLHEAQESHEEENVT